jgi:hypothetical protein
MMEAQLVGILDDETSAELTKAAQRFTGRLVKIVIAEVTEKEAKRGRKS